MRVSDALAILVYTLVFDRATRAKELSARARGATSIPFQRRFPSASASPATPRRVSGSLRSSRARGAPRARLARRAASACRPAGKDCTLRGMTYEEAERYLFLAWGEHLSSSTLAAAQPTAPLRRALPLSTRPTRRSSCLPTWTTIWGRCWRRSCLAAASDDGESVPPADIAMEDAAAAAPTTSAMLAQNQT